MLFTKYHVQDSIEMRPSTHLRVQFNGFRAYSSVSNPNSPAPAFWTLEEQFREKLTKRSTIFIEDTLSPTNSHLLNITLANSLPTKCYPKTFSRRKLHVRNTQHSALQSIQLPQGHHLVYFPPNALSNYLLPDGTDQQHSPGPPFTRRLWAGGSLLFNEHDNLQLKIDRQPRHAVCEERITDVRVKGEEGEEKVFVKIERAIRHLRNKISQEMAEYLDTRKDEKAWNLALVETRDLVFMRDKTAGEAREDVEKVGKVLKRTYLLLGLGYILTRRV
jgi:hypothetical protein